MRRREIAREAWRNVASGTTRVVLGALALATLCGVLAWLDVRTARAVVDDAQRFRDAGGAVWVLAAPGLVDGAACETLGQVPGVQAAGALREGPRHRVPALPQQPVSGLEVSPGFAGVLGVDARAGGVLLPTELAARLGAVPGGGVALDGTEAPVAGVYRYPDDGRRPGLGYAVLSPSPADAGYDECWASTWPQSPEVRGLLLATLSGPVPPGPQQPTVVQLNTTLGASFDAAGRFAGRPTAWAPWAALLGGFALGACSVLLRRLELASHQHAGVGRDALTTQHLLEAGAWVALTWLLDVAVVTAAVLGLPLADAGPLFLLGVLPAFAGGIGALLGSLVGVAATPERVLFSAFKMR